MKNISINLKKNNIYQRCANCNCTVTAINKCLNDYQPIWVKVITRCRKHSLDVVVVFPYKLRKFVTYKEYIEL